ncbi:MAG: methyltransferase domain-containing protein [Thermodesulfobacteriota bacterium]
MSDDRRPFWQKASQVFDERAVEYDSWYDESLLFAIELAALKELETELSEPRIEIGVGPGRFASELGVTLGIDPARAPLTIATQRIVGVCQGVGEDLPLARHGIGTCFILFTLCFTRRPARVLTQVGQALRPGGHLVLGVIPASGPWGRALQAKKEDGHPFYQYATFYEITEIEGWLTAAGLEVVEQRSSLYQKPEALTEFEPSRDGWSNDAGFVVLVARKGWS